MAAFCLRFKRGAQMVYCAYQEEVPVTLIVGMIGKDGWVLASDRIRIDSEAIRVRSHIEKITTDESLGLSYAFYGDDCAILTGDQLIKNGGMLRDLANETRFRQWLWELGNNSWQWVVDSTPNEHKAKFPPNYLYRGLLICLRSSPNRFWWMQIGQQSLVTTVTNKVVVGDGTNSARFFIDHCYSPEMSVAQLSMLAAHTIAVGGMLNPAGVGGLDIVTCQNGTMRLLPEDELQDLVQRSHKLNAKITKLF
jgi:hypothetical protein